MQIGPGGPPCVRSFGELCTYNGPITRLRISTLLEPPASMPIDVIWFASPEPFAVLWITPLLQVTFEPFTNPHVTVEPPSTTIQLCFVTTIAPLEGTAGAVKLAPGSNRIVMGEPLEPLPCARMAVEI